MKRRLFITVSVLSLVLCLATAVLWVRSIWFVDSAIFTAGGRLWRLTSADRDFQIEYVKGWPQAEPIRRVPSNLWGFGDVAPPLDQDDAEWHATRRRDGPIFWTRSGLCHTYLTPDGRVDWVIWSKPYLGNLLERFLDAPRTASMRWHSVSFPPSALVGMLAIAPAILAVRTVARCFNAMRKRLRQLCRNCGYDLRATPGRCPECGTPAKWGEVRTFLFLRGVK